MNRRHFLAATATLLLSPYAHSTAENNHEKISPLTLSEQQWRNRLSEQQFHILREAGTEPAHSSQLNHEKRIGHYHCAGCDLELFTSKMKFDSGTGWPSFTTAIKGHTETKLDFLMLFPRTEYHCARCGGHQGHIFNDGPKPTGKRWCNNGLALIFKAESSL